MGTRSAFARRTVLPPHVGRCVLTRQIPSWSASRAPHRRGPGPLTGRSVLDLVRKRIEARSPRSSHDRPASRNATSSAHRLVTTPGQIHRGAETAGQVVRLQSLHDLLAVLHSSRPFRVDDLSRSARPTASPPHGSDTAITGENPWPSLGRFYDPTGENSWPPVGRISCPLTTPHLCAFSLTVGPRVFGASAAAPYCSARRVRRQRN